MLTEDEREHIRRAFYLEHHSMRRLAAETGHCVRTIASALDQSAPPAGAHPTARRRVAPVLGPFQARLEELVDQNARLPRKQRLTARRIWQLLREEGFAGGESTVRAWVAAWRQERQPPEVFLPLAFAPGQDAQVDWGEAIAVVAGVRQTVQLFVMRLCASRRTFAMAFPSQKQESFFYGHVRAFEHFDGVPARVSYDNLATAVKLAFDAHGRGGRRRQEQRTFVSFRSHYLFESHFCTPGEAHEKGGVEHAVGYIRRNAFVPIPEVASFDDLNLSLLRHCLHEDQRRVVGATESIGAAWEAERPYLRPLPPFAYDCCAVSTGRVTPYSQVVFETNRYSVPVNHARREVTVKAYPFTIELLDRTTLLARHPHCYGREQDCFDPLHYLPLLEQRPGAFDYAKPLRQWRDGWPASYHQLLRLLREKWPEGRGVQEFVHILQLHADHPASLVERAVEQALVYGCVHLDGVLHCLHQVAEPPDSALRTPGLDRAAQAALRELAQVGTQPIDLARYDRLLTHPR